MPFILIYCIKVDPRLKKPTKSEGSLGYIWKYIYEVSSSCKLVNQSKASLTKFQSVKNSCLSSPGGLIANTGILHPIQCPGVSKYVHGDHRLNTGLVGLPKVSASLPVVQWFLGYNFWTVFFCPKPIFETSPVRGFGFLPVSIHKGEINRIFAIRISYN